MCSGIFFRASTDSDVAEAAKFRDTRSKHCSVPDFAIWVLCSQLNRIIGKNIL